MAKKSMILKQQAPAKFSTRKYNRCKLCGRPHAYLRDYGVPCLLPHSGLQGRDPRCPQGFLVNFFRHTSLARLGVHKVRLRLAASSDEKNSNSDTARYNRRAASCVRMFSAKPCPRA